MENREKILAEALHLFSQKGYDAVGVQEIVEAAGISKPTMYYYFKSKRGLLDALIEERGTHLINSITEVSRQKEDIGELLKNLTRTYFMFGKQEKKFYFFMLSLMYSPNENEAHKAVGALVRQQLTLVTEIFKQASAVLGNMNGRQEQFATSFLGMINAFMLFQNERENGLEELTRDCVINRVVHQFLHGIYS